MRVRGLEIEVSYSARRLEVESLHQCSVAVEIDAEGPVAVVATVLSSKTIRGLGADTPIWVHDWNDVDPRMIEKIGVARMMRPSSDVPTTNVLTRSGRAATHESSFALI